MSILSKSRKIIITRFIFYFAILYISAIGLKRLQGFMPDDAFISYRFAFNLAKGYGWVYNIGSPPCNSATSPLYVLLLALSYLVNPNMIYNAKLLFVLSLAGCAVFTFEAFSALKVKTAGLLASAYILSAPWVLSTCGMESALFLLFLAASCYFYIKGSEWTTGIALGLLVLTRGEGVLLAVILCLAWIFIKRRIPFRMFLGGLFLVVPWVVFSLTYFGHLLPNSLYAKMAQGKSGLWGSGFPFFKGFYQIPVLFSFLAWAIIAGSLTLLGLSAILIRSQYRKIIVPLILFSISLILVYGLVLNVPVYHWYYVPIVYVCLNLAAIGTESLLKTGWLRKETLSLAFGGIGALGILVSGIIQIPKGFGPTNYIEVSSWLRQNTSTSAKVAATEIGIIGWFSQRPIIDYLGLLSVESALSLKQKDLTAWIYRNTPDYYVVHVPPWFFEGPVVSLFWFRVAFQKVYETHGVAVFRREMTISEAQISIVKSIIHQAKDQGFDITENKYNDLLISVLRIYFMRADLQKAFGGIDRVNISALLAWAAGPGINIDSSKDTLSKYAVQLTSLSKEIHRLPDIYVNLETGN